MSELQKVIHSHPIKLLLMGTLMGVLLLFGPLILFPNEYLLSIAGDGLKAYYATSYYLLYGEGIYHQGFMYPHGIHMVYMDMNPLLSSLLGLIQKGWNIEPYTVGIINYLVVLGFFPCSYFVYKILRKSLMPSDWAILFALIITFLSPQIRRITGHYSLAYFFFVPMTWWLILEIFSGKRKWLGLYVLLVTLCSFSHPYYFLIGAAFIFMYSVSHAIQHKKEFKKNRLLYLSAIITAIIPGLIIKSWEIFTTQGATDFVKYPYGFIQYRAGFESIFLPIQEPFINVWDAIIKIRRFGVEGYAYVGFVGLLVLAFTVGRIIIHIKKKKSNRIIRPILPPTLSTTIWAAVFILIPAFVYPFQFVPDLLDTVPFVRQFRSMGRLAWIFYYVFMVYSVVLIYKLQRALKIQQRRKLAIGIIVFVTFSWILEAGILGWHERNSFLKNRVEKFQERELDFKAELEKAGYKTTDFQAIIALPYFHIGSEKLQFSHWEGSRIGMTASRNTGLSMTNFMAARTPLSQSLASIQLVSSPLIEKELLAQLPNEKPFLLVYYRDQFSRSESRLIARSKRIATLGKIGMASLPLSAFKSDIQSSLEEFEEKKETLIHLKNQLHSDKSVQGVNINSYGDSPITIGGRVFVAKNQTAELFNGPINTRWDNMILELSFWVKLDQESNYLPRLELSMLRDGTLLEKQTHLMLETKDVYKNWARVAVEFKVEKPNDQLVLKTKVDRLTLDNLMIRPVGINLYSWNVETDCVMMNNYFLCP